MVQSTRAAESPIEQATSLWIISGMPVNFLGRFYFWGKLPPDRAQAGRQKTEVQLGGSQK